MKAPVALARLALSLTIALAAARCDRGSSSGPPSGRTEQKPWFEEVAASRGIDFVHQSGHTGRYLLPEIMGGGAALFDTDRDGDLDLYLVQSGSVLDPAAKTSGNRLFRNRGDGSFENVTAGSGTDVPGYGMGVAAGDYDNDGNTDLYVTNLGGNVLLRNLGAGRFANVTKVAGAGHTGWSTSAAFVDYDSDGDLDLYVTTYMDWSPAIERDCYSPAGSADYCGPKNYQAPAADVLYRNNGNGTFTDVSAAAGVRAALGTGLGVVAGDFNGDGRADIFVANDGTPNHLWLNQGERFVDEALVTGCAVDLDGKAKAGMGVHAADVDDDGDLDVLVVNLENESDSFYRNQGDYFTDDTGAVGLRTTSRPFTRFGMGLLDFDNDGRLDLYEANGRIGRAAETAAADPFAEPNLLFRGLPGGRFAEVVPRGGTGAALVATSRAAAFGDVDNDGGIDIVVVNRDAPAHLLRNVASRGHWVSFRVLDRHGRDSLGATVRLQVAGRSIVRDVRAAYSYLASNDPRVHVGLGEATEVNDVRVTWPDGAAESFGRFPGDAIVTLRRGEGSSR